MFRVRFQLTRISKLTIQKNGGDVDVVYFSSIKQATSEPSMANYYLIGVTQSGTSLRVSLKLGEHFIEINLNDDFMYRFEIPDR